MCISKKNLQCKENTAKIRAAQGVFSVLADLLTNNNVDSTGILNVFKTLCSTLFYYMDCKFINSRLKKLGIKWYYESVNFAL